MADSHLHEYGHLPLRTSMRILDQELLEADAMDSQSVSSKRTPTTSTILLREYYGNDHSSRSDIDFCFVTDDLSDGDEQYVSFIGARGISPAPKLEIPDGLVAVPQKLEAHHNNDDGVVRGESDDEEESPVGLGPSSSSICSPKSAIKRNPGVPTQESHAPWQAANVWECKVRDDGSDFDCKCGSTSYPYTETQLPDDTSSRESLAISLNTKKRLEESIGERLYITKVLKAILLYLL